ncbi:glycosyltransferase [Microlunatus endophyticus]
MSTTGSRIAAVIPAKNEEQRIAATVAAVRDLPHVATVIVVDDGSTDRTGSTPPLPARSWSGTNATAARRPRSSPGSTRWA